MPCSTAIDPRTVQAYRDTDYLVFANPVFVLRVDRPSPPLDAVHRRAGVKCSAFISACNPYSQQLEASLNVARERALKAELTRRGLQYIDGLGQHPSNHWPGEASVLVLGLSDAEARALAARYAQNALLWMGADTAVELVLLR